MAHETISIAVTCYEHVEQFRTAAAPAFAADPVGTTVAASVSAEVARAVRTAAAPSDDGALWAVVRSGDAGSGEGTPLGLVMKTPPWPLHLTPMPDAAAAAVARFAHERGEVFDTVSGDAAATAAFVREWCRLTGAGAELAVAEGVHVLGTLVPPAGVPGTARTATADDADLLAGWLAAFAAEVHPSMPPQPVDVARTAQRLAAGTMLLWVDGDEPVSLAGWHPPSAGTGRIGPVYTPSRHRGHGFAAAVTATAARALQAVGADQVMLFTDLANPTSNGVYARIGFERVGDASEWTITP